MSASAALTTKPAVDGNPLNEIDPEGLQAIPMITPLPPGFFGGSNLPGLGSSIIASLGNWWFQHTEQCNDNECEEQQFKDLTNRKIVKATKGKAKGAICNGTAITRYGECLKAGGIHGIKAPLYWGN